ncbi:hypothetical protein [Niameybacter massiliensis]|uniref:hypothetical protein n=1 Tax=Niameybacter massiliensis TaxID=1658108 RepID=UPI0006B5306F|nr:hypothetical protein [Niameybacter massiliensis]
MDELLEHFADLFIRVNTVELLYDNVIEQVISILSNIVDTISRNIFTYDDWTNEKEIYIQLLELRLSSVLDIDVEATKVLDFLEDVRKSDSNIDIHKSIVKYIDKL